jgi:hypothetical protein
MSPILQNNRYTFKDSGSFHIFCFFSLHGSYFESDSSTRLRVDTFECSLNISQHLYISTILCTYLTIAQYCWFPGPFTIANPRLTQFSPYHAQLRRLFCSPPPFPTLTSLLLDITLSKSFQHAKCGNSRDATPRNGFWNHFDKSRC